MTVQAHSRVVKRGSCSWRLVWLAGRTVGLFISRHVCFLISKTVLLVDECTSGVDPLSRRALWKTLASYREDRCIVFTTHVSLS
jgi:ABC-type phosphate transport system ATPase subunit